MSGLEQPYPGGGGYETNDLKDALRRAIRANRLARPDRRREEAAARFATVVDTIPQVRAARCIAAYAARSSEPRTHILLERLAERGIRVLLPVLGAGLQRGWAEYAGSEDLRERAPGRPPEPGTETLGPDALAEADLIIAPALAVDTEGMRLGQGGGWYDRALEYARPQTPVVAVVFPEEVYDATTRPLPREWHDREVDAVATTDEWRWLRRGGVAAAGHGQTQP